MKSEASGHLRRCRLCGVQRTCGTCDRQVLLHPPCRSSLRPGAGTASRWPLLTRRPPPSCRCAESAAAALQAASAPACALPAPHCPASPESCSHVGRSVAQSCSCPDMLTDRSQAAARDAAATLLAAAPRLPVPHHCGRQPNPCCRASCPLWLLTATRRPTARCAASTACRWVLAGCCWGWKACGCSLPCCHALLAACLQQWPGDPGHPSLQPAAPSPLHFQM